MMNLVARTLSFVSSSTSVRPGKKYYGRSMEFNCSRGTDFGYLIKAQIYLKPPIIITMSNSGKAFLQQGIQNWMTTVLGLLKSGKLRLRRTIDCVRPVKTSWRMVHKVRLGNEEILLDGTAQSLRNEEALRDRSGRLDDVNSQEEARPQKFVIGYDETELELSVESRSFVNRGE